MLDLKQTAAFSKWRSKLDDGRARALIASRLDRLALEHFGDAKPISDGICELRIDYGPGYRIYYHRQGNRIVVLLCGGDKSSQKRDIRAAKRLLCDWINEHGTDIHRL